MGSSGFELSRLRAAIRPFRLHWFPRLNSTSSHAAAMRKRGKLFAPAIVLTGHQLAGRGRGKNGWWSGTGSLTVTFVLPVHEHRLPHQVPLIAGLAVRDALARHTGISDLQLKWPNDLLHGGKKLAGLLCERLDGVDLIGLGLNVNVRSSHLPRALRPRVTALSAVAGLKFDLTDVLAEVAGQLHAALSRPDEPLFSEILRQYNHHHALTGQTIRITQQVGEADLSGTCMGLDTMGRLLVRQKNQTFRIIAGHVEF